MLDPVQREALAEARKGEVSVSGAAGTGKTRLANALAADAVSRGLTCLLVGDDPGLDAARDIGMSPPVHPSLSARARSARVALPPAELRDDPFALRASLFPAEAAVALRILRRAREIQAEHAFAPSDVAAIAARRMPSQRTMALIGVTCADAALLADAFWTGNARSGRTLGDVVAAIRGDHGGPSADPQALAAATGSSEHEQTVDALSRDVDEGLQAVVGFADLRRALDPWAWGDTSSTVAELHAAVSARAKAFAEAAELMGRHGSVDAAIGASGPADAAKLVLSNHRRSFPGMGRRESEGTFRHSARRDEGRADALSPFVGGFGAVRISQVEAAVESRAAASDPGARLEALVAVRDASARLAGLLAELARSLPDAALAVVHGKALDDVIASVASTREETERTRSLRELAGLRANFSKAGFGDVLSAGATLERALAGPVKLDDAPGREPDSPRMLDLLLEGAAPGPDGERTWSPAVSRWRPGVSPLPSGGSRFDVVVVDDAVSLAEADLAALRAMAPKVHLVGVERGLGIDLPVPHRNLSGALANLGRAPSERGWAGGPGGFGVVVREIPEGVDFEEALGAALAASRAAGLKAVDARDPQGAGDVVVVARDSVGEAEIKAAAARAGAAVLVLARECSWTPPPPPAPDVPEDERCLLSAGWALDVNAQDGRVYSKDDRSVIVTDEPDAFGAVAETVAERVARLSAAGWSPVVAWRGSPRGADDMLRLAERNAVPNASHLEMELATFPLPTPRKTRPEPVAPAAPAKPAPKAVAYEDIPASPHRDGSFHDVVWKLKWLREEVLLRANPDRAACLLTDERILSLIRMGVDDEASWQAKVRGAVLRGADPRQIALRGVVMDVVGNMVRGNFVTQKLETVAAVAYEPTPSPRTGAHRAGAGSTPAFMLPVEPAESLRPRM